LFPQLALARLARLAQRLGQLFARPARLAPQSGFQRFRRMP
jgi:hypothetical protein